MRIGVTFGLVCACVVGLAVTSSAQPPPVPAVTGSAALSQIGPVTADLADLLPTLVPARNSETKLQPNTVILLRLIEKTWSYYATEGVIYGWREDPIPDHPSGQALDIMAKDGGRTPESVAYGSGIAAFLMANARELGITYLIWRQHIWNPGSDWRLMSARGGWTDNHMDHIHVLVNGSHVPAGALVYPGDAFGADGPPSPASMKKAFEQRITVLRQAVAAARIRLVAARNQAGLVAANHQITVQGALDAQRTIDEVVRRTYMFGLDVALVTGIVGLAADPLAVGMAQEVAERTNQNQRDAYEVAKTQLVAAKRDDASQQAELPLAKQALALAKQQLADATSRPF